MDKSFDFCLLGKEKLFSESKKEGIQDIKRPDLIASSFCYLIVGKPGSGKTSLIEEFLLNKKLLNNMFEFILIFSPNMFTNIKCIEDENYSKTFDISKIYTMIEKINSNEKIKDVNKNLLIIFDDFISDMKKEAINPSFTKLFYNRRHLLNKGCISFIITSQKFTVTPYQIRPCINMIAIFKLNSSEYNSIKKDVCSWVDLKIFTNLKNEYDFLHFNLTNGYIFLNLQTLLS